jgi:hypothetical protein
MASASDFQISSTSYEQSLEENDVLEVEANITNQNSTGIQEVKLLKDSSKVFTQNLKLQANESKNITLSYTIESGDAKENADFTVKTENDTESLTIDIATLERSFSQGWNYFSLPIATQSQPDISNILEENKVEAVWRYEDGSWESYAPAAQENPFNSFKGGEGYIVNADNSFTIRPNVENTMDFQNVEDSSPVSEEMQQGWNLIGHYWEEKQNSGTNYALDSLPSDAAGATYKQDKSGELSLTQLNGDFKPGHAYWQFVNTDTEYGKSESNPTTENNCCNPGTAVKEVPNINGNSIEVVKNRTGTIELDVSFFDRADYLNRSEFQEKTVTKAYITDKRPDYSLSTEYPNVENNASFEKICEKEGGLDEEQDVIQCDVSTENLSYGKYWIAWNTTREDKNHWQEDISRYNELKVIAKKIPRIETRFEGFFTEEIIVQNDTGTIAFEPDYYGDESTNEDIDQYLNESEFQNQTITKVYISDTQPDYEADLSSNKFTKICEKESNLNNNHRVTCNVSTEDLSKGEHWIGYNITRKDNRSWKSDAHSRIRVLNQSYTLNEEINFSDHSLEFNKVNAIPSEYYNDEYDVNFNITASKLNEDAQDDFAYRLWITDSEKETISDNSLQSIEINGDSRTEEQSEQSEAEPSYILLTDRNDNYAVLNLTDPTFGEIPQLTSNISPKFTDDTVSLGEQVNVSLGYDDSQDTERYLTQEEFVNQTEVSVYLIDQTETWLETGDEISTYSVGDKDFYQDGVKPTVDVEDSSLSQNICSGVQPSEKGSVNCSISTSQLEAGRTHFVVWKIEKSLQQKKYGGDYFTAIKNLNETEMAENKEVKINVSHIQVTEPSDGWKDISIDSFLHNNNMTYSGNNATSSDFTVLDERKGGIESDSGNAEIPGVDDVRAGYNETEESWYETIVDTAEPQHLLARVEYGELGDKPTFAFKINRSDIQ